MDKSLVLAETSGRSQARYNCLETIREYALEKLEEAGETQHLRDVHLDVFLARAEEAAPKLNETYQQVWLNWLEGEHDNLRAALAWALDSGRIEAGLRIATALVRFWEIRGYIREGLTWFERFLARADERIPLPVHANALTFASFMAMFLSDALAATTFGQKAVDLAESVDDDHDPILILALSGLSSSARIKGDFQTAFTIGERGIDLLRDSPGPAYFLGMALLAQGSVAIELGYFDYARTTLNESLAIAREAGDAFRIAHALNSLGDLARCELNYEAARIAYEESVRLLREVNALHDLASVLQNLGHTYLHLGNIERAHALFRESMETHLAFQNGTGKAECLVGFAAIAIVQGLPGAGVRLLGASATVGGQRVAAASVWHATRMEYEQTLSAAQKSLSEAEFQAEQAAGSGMTLEQAVNFAMNLPLQPATAPATGAASAGLTTREREVARLIGQGRSNGEIAIELVLSKRTVETHVSNILSKLALTSRSQVMRWAIDHGLSQTLA
ncbi:LuxR family transcriptional regulator [bacterium]|nr:MAG: LuxR family transcriptional regulator [bacterium]